MKINNKAFTLIELLAVIVILAIIALIATPIVLNIINESKENARLRSAEMYLDAVEQSVALEKMNNTTFNPNSCIIEKGNLNCDSKDVEVEVNGEVPESGNITFTNGKIDEVLLTYSNGKTIVKENNKLVYGEKAKTIDDICKYVSGTAKTAGAKYSCEVKEGTSYNFYVLKTPAEGDTTINLIMDQNINSDGTLAGMTGVTQFTNASQYNLVAWISNSTHGCGSDGDYCATNEKGPITAMQFLYNATKDWTNIDPVNYTYNDRTVQGNADGEGYTSFVSSNGVATITPVTGDGVTIGSEAAPLRARMPIYASDTTITEVTSKTNASYLYDNLPTSPTAPYGYWTLSSYAGNSSLTWGVGFTGSVSTYSVYGAITFGVRPVINLKI